MRAVALFAVVGVLAAVATGFMLQTPPSDRPPVEPSPQINSMPPLLMPSGQLEPASAHVGGAVPPTSRPTRSADIDGLATGLNQIVSEHIATYLQESGLSKADSDRIVATGSRHVEECALRAMSDEAESRGVTLEVLTQTLAGSQRDRKAVPSDLIDSLQAKLISCQVNAAQQAGIPLSVLEEAMAKVRAAVQ
jgi:hypothetical protein